MSNNDWAVVFTTSDVGIQATASMLLDEARIKYCVEGGNHLGVTRSTRVARILVSQHDMEAASSVLKELEPEYTEVRKDFSAVGTPLVLRVLLLLMVVAGLVYIASLYSRYIAAMLAVQ